MVDTTAVTWNMVIASDTDNDHPPNVTVPDVFDRVGTLTQGEDGFDDQCHLAVACRRLEGTWSGWFTDTRNGRIVWLEKGETIRARTVRVPENQGSPNPQCSERASLLASASLNECLPPGKPNRAFAPQQDHAARQDEEQQQHVPDQVENEPERRNHTAKAEGLNEEQNGDEGRDPGQPPRQGSASEHEHPCCESEETAEDVATLSKAYVIRYSVWRRRSWSAPYDASFPTSKP